MSTPDQLLFSTFTAPSRGNVHSRHLADHYPQHQQRGSADCEETAHGQRKRFKVVAHSPPALCRASAVALSAMILTVAAAHSRVMGGGGCCEA